MTNSKFEFEFYSKPVRCPNCNSETLVIVISRIGRKGCPKCIFPK